MLLTANLESLSPKYRTLVFFLCLNTNQNKTPTAAIRDTIIKLKINNKNFVFLLNI